MKKTITLLLLAVITLAGYAAKSSGQAHSFNQSDGTQITVVLLGDEDFSWYQTIDGVLLVREDNDFYIAKCDSNAVLSSTGVLAHDSDRRSDQELQAISLQDKSLFFNNTASTTRAKSRHRAISGYPSNSFCPHKGTVRVPIILMGYKDMPFTFSDKETWDNYFNSEITKDSISFNGYGSVRQFFYDASQGKLNFEFDIYGPYTANNEHDYYGNKGSHSLDLLKEAVSKANADIDFTQYDSNKDGKVDMVYIVYAGTGANLSGNDNDFWPACWYNVTGTAADGKTINIIGGASELATKNHASMGTVRAGIGVTCHEISHGLGLPDLYWTKGANNLPKDSKGYVDPNNCGPEDWDLMDGGENLYNAMWPCQYTAWEREIMGWLDVEELTRPRTVTLYPLNKEGGKAYRVTNPANKYEYYIIENYQNDEWNSYVTTRYGSNSKNIGLMITHVNSSSTGLSMTPNNTYGKPNVTLIPADGFILASYANGKTIQYQGKVVTMPAQNEKTADGKLTYNWVNNYFIPDTKGDPYPGTQNVTSVAAYKNYTGADMVNKYPITDITQNKDGSVTFYFMGGTPLGDANDDGIVDISDVTATIRYVLDPIGAKIFQTAADIDKDGKVTVRDIERMKRIILKK